MNVDKENTFRVLKEEPLLARKQWHCRVGLHTWLPWNEPQKNRHGAYDYVEQYRKCGFCGKADRNVLVKT